MLIALISGAVALCFGIVQFYLNTKLFSVVFEGKYGKTALYACLKLALYGAGIALLVLKFRSCAIPAAVGFGVLAGLGVAVGLAVGFGVDWTPGRSCKSPPPVELPPVGFAPE